VVEQEAEEEAMKDVTLFNLIAAYKSALDHMPKRFIHEVALLPVSVDEQTSFVADYLRVHGPSRFLAVVRHMTEKIRIVVTVVALLEMTKNRLVTLRPVESGDDILITPVAPVLPFMTVPSSAA
jgi:segregation and condensation protein A